MRIDLFSGKEIRPKSIHALNFIGRFQTCSCAYYSRNLGDKGITGQAFIRICELSAEGF